MRSVWLALALPCLALGCLAADQVTRPMDSMLLLTDDEAMKEEVLRYITPGMSVKEARAVMEQNDFKCSFRNYAPGERPYLACKAIIAQTSSWQSLLKSAGVASVVEVRLFYDTKGVSDILVRHYTDGP